MEVYVDSLLKSIQSIGYKAVEVQAQSRFERFSGNLWFMRWLRYRSFPHQLNAAPKADIHHVTDHGYAHLHPALGEGKTCVTVHDLIPILSYREKILLANRAKYPKPHLNFYSLSFLTRFDLIIAASQTTKADLIEQLDLDESRIRVVPPMISDDFRPAAATEIDAFATRYSLDTSKKWIMLSGSEFYKNLEVALDVFALVREQLGSTVGLIKTGVLSNEFIAQLEARGLVDEVRQIYIESSADMPLVYSFSDCLLFPSLYEGFGMPVLEAIACHTPVVASNGGALSELANGLIEHCDPFDAQAMADNVILALEDDSQRQRVIDESDSVLSPYRLKRVAAQMHAAYSEL